MKTAEPRPKITVRKRRCPNGEHGNTLVWQTFDPRIGLVRCFRNHDAALGYAIRIARRLPPFIKPDVSLGLKPVKQDE
jgi:hypothetical protein